MVLVSMSVVQPGLFRFRSPWSSTNRVLRIGQCRLEYGSHPEIPAFCATTSWKDGNALLWIERKRNTPLRGDDWRPKQLLHREERTTISTHPPFAGYSFIHVSAWIHWWTSLRSGHSFCFGALDRNRFHSGADDWERRCDYNDNGLHFCAIFDDNRFLRRFACSDEPTHNHERFNRRVQRHFPGAAVSQWSPHGESDGLQLKFCNIDLYGDSVH